jgi:thioredoxin 1
MINFQNFFLLFLFTQVYSRVLLVNSLCELEQILKNHKHVILKFSASWCQPCRLIKNDIEKISCERSDFIIVEASLKDQAEVEEIFAKFKIKSMPYFIVFSCGQELGRIKLFNNKNNFLDQVDRLLQNKNNNCL